MPIKMCDMTLKFIKIKKIQLEKFYITVEVSGYPISSQALDYAHFLMRNYGDMLGTLGKLILVTDNTAVVHLLQQRMTKMPINAMLRSILGLIKRAWEVKILHVYRDSNQVAGKMVAIDKAETRVIDKGSDFS